MAGKTPRSLQDAFRNLALTQQPLRATHTSTSARLPSTTRSMATTRPPPTSTPSNLILPTRPSVAYLPQTPSQTYTHFTPTTHVPLTIHAFPSLEPLRLESWSAKHLHLPMRRDILHSAIVYEGDSTRQGTASSKTRWEIVGSNKKIYRQKGSGRARMGRQANPSRRGGGKTFGPKPRDFSTGINKKVYDLAWRTALSYRYRKGQLVVCEDGMEMPLPEEFLALSAAGKMGREVEDGFVAKYVRQLLGGLEWGGREFGRTLFITGERRPNLFTGMEVAGEQGRALMVEEVDVKDLLELERVVVERSALAEMIDRHQSDLRTSVYIHGVRQMPPPMGEEVDL